MSYKILWEENGCKITVTDVLGNDFLKPSIKVTTDARFINSKYRIVDFNMVKEFPIDSNTIRQIAESDIRAYKINPNIKIAILANKLVIKGLANVYNTYFELSNDDKTWELKIFETENQAREWINSLY